MLKQIEPWLFITVLLQGTALNMVDLATPLFLYKPSIAREDEMDMYSVL